MTEDANKSSRQNRVRGDSRFTRLLGLCGLTHPEAAEYLDIGKQTVAMRAAGNRQTPESEISELLDLWAKIKNNNERLGESFPAGARRQQHAYWEAEILLRKENPDDYGGSRQLQYYDPWLRPVVTIEREIKSKKDIE